MHTSVRSKVKLSFGKHSKVLLVNSLAIKKFKSKYYYNFKKECYVLKKLRPFFFVPRLVKCNEKKITIIMENVGEKNWRKMNWKERLYSLIVTLFICLLLDLVRIRKTELNHTEKHLYLKGLRVILIDWERAKLNANRNLTQFLQFLENKTGVRISASLKRKLSRNKVFFPLLLFILIPKLFTFNVVRKLSRNA